MNHIKRITTSILGGSLFLGIYFYSYLLFVVGLAGVLLYVLFFEWPRLVGGIFSFRYFLTVPFFPTIPFITLGALTIFFAPFSKLLPLYPFIISWVCDTCAYTAGTLYGRHKLLPTISPNKSWEGALGGLCGVVIANAISVQFLKDYFLTSIVAILISSLLLTTLAIAGDIFMSYLKRQAFIKDAGIILPGHGGILDRFDSVLFVGPAVFAWVMITKFYFPGLFL